MFSANRIDKTIAVRVRIRTVATKLRAVLLARDCRKSFDLPRVRRLAGRTRCDKARHDSTWSQICFIRWANRNGKGDSVLV